MRHPPRVRVSVAVGLGSNLGDRRGHLDYARARLGNYLSELIYSRDVETEPVGVGAQPRFLNAAAIGKCALGPHALLEALLAIERERGRQRSVTGAARTLDLDLVLYGDRIIKDPGLTVPHPRFRERWFVLEPLAQIAPDFIDPATKLTVAALRARVAAPR